MKKRKGIELHRIIYVHVNEHPAEGANIVRFHEANIRFNCNL